MILPPVIIGLGLILFLRLKRQTKAFIRISPKEFEVKNVSVYGKRLKANVNKKKCSWVVETKPSTMRTRLGLIPFYFCEVGKATTSNLLDTQQTSLTEKELSMIEDQSILSSLLKADALGKESIMMLIGAVGVGAVLGIIIGKMFLFGGA